MMLLRYLPRDGFEKDISDSQGRYKRNIHTYESEKEGGLDQIYLKSSFKMTKRVSALDISFAKKCSCFILSERRAM